MRENRRDVFLALVLLVSLFLVPLICCVTASAQEAYDLPNHDYPVEIAIPDTLKYYPVVTVGTSAGSYATSSAPGSVYAYLTSNNNPKASTRASAWVGTPLENGSYVVTTSMIFKNHSGASPTENNFTFTLDVFDDYFRMLNEGDGYLTDPAHLSYYTDLYFTFSNFTNVDVSVTNLPTNNSVTAPRTFTYSKSVSANSPLYIWEIYADIYNAYGYGDFSDHGITSKIQIKVNSSAFDGKTAESSYVKVFSPAVTHREYYETYLRTVNYVQDVTGWYDWHEYLGYQEGHTDGENTGYIRGYDDGLAKGESLQHNPGWFTQGVDSILSIRLFEYSIGDSMYDFTLGTILAIALGGTALLWFLKIYAGG